jgi:two-component system, sensor histidine kinase RegB
VARLTVRLAAIPDRNRVNLSWLVRLRWAQLAGQAATVTLVALLLDAELPVLALCGIVIAGVVSNLVVEVALREPRPVHDWHLAAIMALDVALLTGLLYFTGGPLNPFGFLYLVQIALATVLLHARLTWALVAFAFLGFGILVAGHRPLEVPEKTRMIGMWVALGVASAFIVHFLLRVLGSLAQREEELAAAHNLAARQERLASLATMAAGAAHELSTPLGTVALVAKELEHQLAENADPRLVEDARLIREQVGRCRVILDQMAGSTATAGEGIQALTVGEILDESMQNIRPVPPVMHRIADDVASLHAQLPPRAIGQALRSLVTNAQDASGPDGIVEVSTVLAAGKLVIDIVDQGPGMPPEILTRIGEPFFTTKPPGRGMGLGIFLARAVIESLGGNLLIESRAGEGTRVSIVLPTKVERQDVVTTELA